MKEGTLVIGGLRDLEIDFEVRNRLRELDVGTSGGRSFKIFKQ